jgi:hypothetical protein
MTKESLRQLIREMVQEEVRQVLPQVMTEIFSSKLNPQVSNKTVVQKPVVQKPVVQQPIKKEYKKYTDNELLNKALNETVGGVPREGDIASSGFNSAPSVMDHINQAPPVVAQALTKDYSALMKAIDKKRKGGISSNNV